MGRKGIHEVDQIGILADGSCGVIGVTEENNSGFVCDRIGDSLEIRNIIITHGDIHQCATVLFDNVVVVGIGRGSNDRFYTLTDQDFTDKAKSGGSTLGNQYIFRLQSMQGS